MKQIFRNNYITISLIKGIVLGIGYDDQQLIIMVGVFAIEVKMWMFKPAPKSKTIKVDGVEYWTNK